MRKLVFLWVIALTGMAFSLLAEDYRVGNGTTYTGKISNFAEDGIIIRLDSGGFSPKIPWTQFSQEQLKEFAKDPKAAAFVNSLIEMPEDTGKKVKEIKIKSVERPERPAKKPGFISSMMTTPVGLTLVALMILSSAYAGYEVAIFKERAPAMIVAVSTVLPFLGPIIFLSLPPENAPVEVTWAPSEPARANEAIRMPSGSQVPTPDSAVGQAPAAKAANGLEGQVFRRGEFTFNRKFIESKFAAFFGPVARGVEGQQKLVIKAGKNEYQAKRITRIAMNDMHVQLLSQTEQAVSFAEIAEISVQRDA